MIRSMARRLLRGPAARAASRVGHLLLLALGWTWRVRHVGGERVTRARGGGAGSVLYAFPHGVLLPLVFTHRGRGVHILASESRDGEVIARVSERLGFSSVRGSTSRGGARALRRLAEQARAGGDLAVAPDGPRGPRGSVGPGIVFVAAHGGVPIAPLGVAARPAWQARSWDRFLVPAPFARVWVYYGEPIRVGRPAERIARQGLLERISRALVEAERGALECARGVQRSERASRLPA